MEKRIKIVLLIVYSIAVFVITMIILKSENKRNDEIYSSSYIQTEIAEELKYKEVDESKLSIEEIRKIFTTSYNSLKDEVNSLNISNQLNNNSSAKIIQTPKVGKIAVLYSKEKADIVYVQYYGQYAGSEVIWIDKEEESPMAKYEGHYGETITVANILLAVNTSGTIRDVRNSNSDFSKYSSIMVGIRDTYENEDYVMREFDWTTNSSGEITISN